ncbi:MAG: glycosyltransferase family 87 protein, partial [Candidatus Sulfotelmatobacter sp.]
SAHGRRSEKRRAALVSSPEPSWIQSFLRWLTPGRLRAQAIVLAICLWGVCAVDFATPGIFDRAGNIKFQDFLPLYISARLISQRRDAELYDQEAQTKELEQIASKASAVRIPYLYGPQVGLLFVPLANLPFLAAAAIWVASSVSMYFICIYALWRCSPNLLPHRQLTALAAIAFPPLFHFFVRGQFSVVPLACFTAAFLALRANRLLLSGIALGLLFAKPQFLLAIPLILLLAQAWKILAGLVLSSLAELAFARLYFGAGVTRAYLNVLLHPSRWIGTAELSHAPIQMHSLRSFWTLLVPWPSVALALYVLTSLVVLTMAVALWRSSSPIALKYSALVLAAILINPHLFVYDLLVLAPALLLILDWTLRDGRKIDLSLLELLLYLAFILPLFGPLSRWTHVQLAVIVFAAILWMLTKIEPAQFA